MQGAAGFVVMPHKTTDAKCSVGAATSTDVGVGDKSPASPSKPTTEGKVVLYADGKFFNVWRHLLNRAHETKLCLIYYLHSNTEMT